MKKIFCVLLGLMIAVCFSLSVSADTPVLQLAQTAGCFTGNILMVDDFSGLADTDDYKGLFSEEVQNGCFYANIEPHMGIENEALWISPKGMSVTMTFAIRGLSRTSALTGSPQDPAGSLMDATGFGFYLNNELGTYFHFVPWVETDTETGNAFTSGSSPNGENIVYAYDIEMDDIVEFPIREDGVVSIPTGFEGYLFISFNDLKAGSETLDQHLSDGNWYRFRLYQYDDSPGDDDSRVVFDNIFLFGDVPAFDTANILNGQIDNGGGDPTPTPEPQPDPTPTPEPVVEPTPTPDNGGQQGGQQGNDNPPSGAISLIGFAVAAVVAGAVIVRKKHN